MKFYAIRRTDTGQWWNIPKSYSKGAWMNAPKLYTNTNSVFRTMRQLGLRYYPETAPYIEAVVVNLEISFSDTLEAISRL